MPSHAMPGFAWRWGVRIPSTVLTTITQCTEGPPCIQLPCEVPCVPTWHGHWDAGPINETDARHSCRNLFLFAERGTRSGLCLLGTLDLVNKAELFWSWQQAEMTIIHLAECSRIGIVFQVCFTLSRLWVTQHNCSHKKTHSKGPIYVIREEMRGAGCVLRGAALPVQPIHYVKQYFTNAVRCSTADFDKTATGRMWHCLCQSAILPRFNLPCSLPSRFWQCLDGQGLTSKPYCCTLLREVVLHLSVIESSVIHHGHEPYGTSF